MASLSISFCMLALLSLLTSVLAASLPSQAPIQRQGSRNITLTFDDLPTHHGLGTIAKYHHLDFSSFLLVNTTFAASTGHISPNDTGCATSSHNALIAQKSKTPSLWPRIALNPLAYGLPGEVPFFNMHGLSSKAVNQSDRIVCIGVQAYGIDEERSLRAYSAMSVCTGPQFRGGHLNITDIWPTWGRAVNMIEITAEALIDHGEDEEIEWEDWPFCVDDIVVERLDGLDEWEWPDLGWPGGIPLLPPLAPFKFDDQGLRRAPGQHSLFSEDGRAGFDLWRARGAEGVFLKYPPLAT
jgi:hypothetical protein